MTPARYRTRLDRLDKILARRTHADAAEPPADQDRDRYLDLLRRQRTGGLCDTDQIELELLERRFPPSELDKAIMAFRVKHGQL
jgi:hypothetical protein